MGKPRPHNKKASKTKSREKSVLGAGGSISKRKMNEDPAKLLEQATILLQTGQADAALELAQQALQGAPANSPAQLSSLNAVAEIYVELGEVELAKQHFLKAVELDPNGAIPESEGGGAEKFLWLAQLSELGGKDSVQWFEKGVGALRNVIQQWEEDAESRCEALITEALLVQPNSPEVLQTLASIRISQLREDDARAALSRSLELWKDLPPEDPNVPDFPTRISLSRLLMEVSMLLEALEVLERLILEDDQSVEAWYLGGWCLNLLAEKGEAPKDPEEAESTEAPESKRQASLVASREWLKQSLTLYDHIQYEDDRLKAHALELVEAMNKELGEDVDDDDNAEDGEGGEEEWEGIDSDSDHEMADSKAEDKTPYQPRSGITPSRSRVRTMVQSQSSLDGVAKSSMMDLVSAPRGESPSLKTPLVEVEAAEVAPTENAVAVEEKSAISQSEYETDSEGLNDEWETESLYEDAIQMIRDEQLRDGSIPDACTLEEAVEFRKRLHEIGKAQFVEETIARDAVSAKKLCTAFGILPPAFLEGAPDEIYHPLLAIAISREFTRRQKLPQYNSVDDAAKLLKESKNIIVLTGAGISTSLGIPDFRSKDTGLYSQLEHLGLSDPQEVFDIQIFREDPSIFYSIAKDILPTEKKYSPTHGFIRLLQDKGKLLTNYTQNIDNIEANAGVLPENIVQCHGSFAKATCVKCQFKVSGDEIYDEIKKGVVPECAQCRKQIAEDSLKPQGQKRKRNSNGVHRDRSKDGGDSSDEDDYEIPTPGVMKPDITFFGEDLPDEFGRRLLHHDRDKVDLVIVIGTSLKVAPVAEVPGVLPPHIPQIYISRTVSRRRMEYVIRFAQAHETFRQPELQALANVHNIDLEILSYDEISPYCVIRLPNEEAARTLISRSILARDIFELWGHGTSYDDLHADVRRRTEHLWAKYKHTPFKFTVETFAAKRNQRQKTEVIQSFSYVGFEGPINLKDPDEDFWVLEQFYDTTHNPDAVQKLDSQSESQTKSAWTRGPDPANVYLGRWIAEGSREVINKYDLKKRQYISTTSMDAELSLVTANMAGAAPGKLFYDPFVGTGSFCVAAAHFGALTFGSDIDGRSFRGKEMDKWKTTGVQLNFQQYGLSSNFGDMFTSDLTNTPLLNRQFLDGIVCDPPYGVREGLRVLGSRNANGNKEVFIDGVPAHLRPGYIAPKKPYGFEAMMNDILVFAARTLVTGGRLCMWMPTASDDEVEFLVPMQENLEVVSVSTQQFNNWSRRLITYQRLPEGVLSDLSLARQKSDAVGVSADDLNAFRRIYFTTTPKKIKRSPAPAAQ
ncbi:hypothetical protein BDV06DRAFT_211098 [Aspergillus oleicola]